MMAIRIGTIMRPIANPRDNFPNTTLSLSSSLLIYISLANAIFVFLMNEIWTENLEDMVTIGLFLRIDRRFGEYKEKFRQYFE